MNDVISIRMVESIDRYRKDKDKLEQILFDSSQSQNPDLEESIKQAELDLEEAFADLLHSQPRDVSEILAKSRLLIEEVVSDAELTTYQTQGLLSILHDLSNVVSKTKTQKD